MKKFLFITFHIMNWDAFSANHGIVSLIPIIKEKKWDIKLLTFYDFNNINEFINIINEYKPDIIGYSSMLKDLPYLKTITPLLSKYLQICGGVGPTIEPELFLNETSLNGVCVGKGEKPILEILSGYHDKKYYNINGFYWKNNKKIIKNTISPELDIEKTPIPDYSIYLTDPVFINHIKNIGDFYLTVHRGCKYNCNYCTSSILNKKNNLYYRSPESIINILENILEKFPKTKKIIFLDDVFIVNLVWLKKFTELYIEKIKLPYVIQIRPKIITEKILKLLKYSGCVSIRLGIESGNERIRNLVLNKNETNDEILEKIDLLNKYNIKYYIFIMVGIPTETKEDIKDTYKFIRKIKPNDGHCTYFKPLNKTKLYNFSKNNNLLLDNHDIFNYSYNYGPYIKISDELKWNCVGYRNKIQHYILYRRYLNEKKIGKALINYIGVILNPLISKMFKFQSASML